MNRGRGKRRHESNRKSPSPSPDSSSSSETSSSRSEERRESRKAKSRGSRSRGRTRARSRSRSTRDRSRSRSRSRSTRDRSRSRDGSRSRVRSRSRDGSRSRVRSRSRDRSRSHHQKASPPRKKIFPNCPTNQSLAATSGFVGVKKLFSFSGIKSSVAHGKTHGGGKGTPKEGKRVKREFFCQKNKMDLNYPGEKWTELTQGGLGFKILDVPAESSKEELRGILQKAYPALKAMKVTGLAIASHLPRSSKLEVKFPLVPAMNELVAKVRRGIIFLIPIQEDLPLIQPKREEHIECATCFKRIPESLLLNHNMEHMEESYFDRSEETRDSERVNPEQSTYRDPMHFSFYHAAGMNVGRTGIPPRSLTPLTTSRPPTMSPLNPPSPQSPHQISFILPRYSTPLSNDYQDSLHDLSALSLEKF